jgi:hypothetical protein
VSWAAFTGVGAATGACSVAAGLSDGSGLAAVGSGLAIGAPAMFPCTGSAGRVGVVAVVVAVVNAVGGDRRGRACRPRANRGTTASAVNPTAATTAANQIRARVVWRRARARASTCATRTASSDARTSAESARPAGGGEILVASTETSDCSMIRRLSHQPCQAAKNRPDFAYDSRGLLSRRIPWTRIIGPFS